MPTSRKLACKSTTPPNPSAISTTSDKQITEDFHATIAGNIDEAALSKAQQVICESWDQTNSQSRIAIAHKALAISPLCADAYNLLAAEAETAEESRDLYIRGIEAATLALGSEEFKGHFSGFIETRPYMRARHGLAMALLQLGEEEAAIEHLRAILKLDHDESQGIRYLLLAMLVERDDIPGAKAVLAAYANE